MIKVKEDLTGQAFGRLTVLRQVEDYVSPQGKRKSRWLCECNCAERNQVVATGSKLKNGHTKSCGCLKDEKTSERFKKYNQYSDKLVDQYGEYYIGFASNTNSEFYFDAEYFDKVSKYCWHESIHTIKNYHVLRAYSSELKQHIKMHQLVFGSYCDHIDRNTLNNRKYNLRKATFTENAQNKSIQKNNTSGVVGISWNEKRKKWESSITINGKYTHLGRFVEKDDAIKARLIAEQEHFGEFAPQRHLFEQYHIS